MSLALAMALIVAGPAPEPLPFDQALAAWKRLCVDPLPSGQGFVDAFNADAQAGIGWTVSQGPVNALQGKFWRSRLGVLNYVMQPEMPLFINDPACHFAFVADPAFSQDAAVASVRQALGVDAGKNTGSRKAPQRRWEVDWKNGMHVRIFLSSGLRDPDGINARLSISVRRTKEGE